MIECGNNKTFHLYTDNLSYVFGITDTGHPEHLYFGKRIRDPFFNRRAMESKNLAKEGFSLAIDRTKPAFCLEELMLECTTEGKGDFRQPLVSLEENKTLDLRYADHRAYAGIRRYKENPIAQAVMDERNAETLELLLRDEREKIEVTLIYTLFPRLDVLVRRTMVRNASLSPVRLSSCASMQLDLPAGGYTLLNLAGSYASEADLTKTELKSGTHTIQSRKIFSGIEENPAYAVLDENGGCFMGNLIYSGAHKETFSIRKNGMLHIVTGLNDDLFSWNLEPGEAFESPDAVMTFSEQGIEEASRRMKRFIISAVLRGQWKDRVRPLMLSTGDITGFAINHDKAVSYAQRAKALGFEGIIIDDGWFSVRRGRNTSLGDWYVNPMKFPQGLKELGAAIHRQGLMFGLWFDILTVSRNSNLYEKHPEWALHDPKRKNWASANDDFLLDLTQETVQDWMIETLSHAIETAKLDWIRWDSSRPESDIFLYSDECKSQGEFHHRYISGLCRILNTITRRFPNLFIENYAGGAMFDLGMLNYCHAVSFSKNTDPVSRMESSKGYGVFYPQSVMLQQVEPTPDRIFSRYTDFDSRAEISFFGILSYSVDILNMKQEDEMALRQQIEFYKQYRNILQFGNVKVERQDTEEVWSVSIGDASVVLALYVEKNLKAGMGKERLKITQVDENADYRIFARDRIQTELKDSLYPQELECYEVSGDVLKYAGIALADKDTGNGYTEDMRKLTDRTTRLYIIRKMEKK